MRRRQLTHPSSTASGFPLDAERRSQEVRHRSIETAEWQAAFLEALDQQKEELISRRRDQASPSARGGGGAPARAITLSQKTRAAREEIARVAEEDRLHSQMFQSLQMNAVKTAQERRMQATKDASDLRIRMGETKAKLQTQRRNYIEVRPADRINGAPSVRVLPPSAR